MRILQQADLPFCLCRTEIINSTWRYRGIASTPFCYHQAVMKDGWSPNASSRIGGWSNEVLYLLFQPLCKLVLPYPLFIFRVNKVEYYSFQEFSQNTIMSFQKLWKSKKNSSAFFYRRLPTLPTSDSSKRGMFSYFMSIGTNMWKKNLPWKIFVNAFSFKKW